MSLSRRDLLKIAVAGGAAMTLPLERVAFTSGSAKRMATSAMPKPFTLPFVTPPTLGSSAMSASICWPRASPSTSSTTGWSTFLLIVPS